MAQISEQLFNGSSTLAAIYLRHFFAAHQTSMFSATWPPEVAKLAAEFLRDPLKITIGSEDLTANHDVHQIVEVCEPTGREPKLEQLLRKYHADRK